MNRLLICCALLIAAIPAFAGGFATGEGAALQGKRLYVYVGVPAQFQENENDKVQVALGGRPFGHVLAADGQPLAPLADPAHIVGAQLAAALAAAYGAVAVQGPNPDYELHVNTVWWGFAPHPRRPGLYFLRQGASVKLVRSSDRRVVLEGRCGQETRQHPQALTLDQLRAHQAQWVRTLNQHLAWRCARELAQDTFDVPPERLPSIPPELVDPLAGPSATPAGG